MWIFLNDAFLSIVRPRKGGHIDPETHLMVRGRIPGDIERVFPGEKVLQNKGADYRFRAFIKREYVAERMKEEVERITYSNFKDSTYGERTP